MTNEDRQRAMLMAQLDKRRAMKQKYLRQEEAREAPLTGLVMTNAMLLAIRERVDIFAFLRQLRQEADPENGTILNTAMGWIEALAELLDCSAYELFVDDPARRNRIVTKVLQELETCDSWENIRMDDQGSGSFTLPGFDYAWRMTEQPSATLLFEKTAEEGSFHYTLTLGDGRRDMGLIPSQGVLCRETEGPLQAFTDRVLQELNSGWPVLKEQFQRIRREISAEAEKFQDLLILLEEAPGMNVVSLLKKEADTLKNLREQEKLVYGRMPEKMRESGRGKRSQNTLILLGGAVSALERLVYAMPEDPREALSEVVYMLENAGEPV